MWLLNADTCGSLSGNAARQQLLIAISR